MKQAIHGFILAGAAALATPVWAEIETARDLMEAGRFEEAMQEFLPAARSGNADAEELIGVMYALGLGVERDPERAFEWYLRSSLKGHPGAQSGLGWYYELGLGMPAPDFKHLLDTDFHAFEKKRDDIRWREYKFKLKVNEDTYNDMTRVKYTIQSVEPICDGNFADESKVLIEKLKKLHNGESILEEKVDRPAGGGGGGIFEEFFGGGGGGRAGRPRSRGWWPRRTPPRGGAEHRARSGSVLTTFHGSSSVRYLLPARTSPMACCNASLKR